MGSEMCIRDRAFWDARWQDIMVNDDSSMLKKAIADGFDGIYMDWVEAYDDEYVMARADSLGIDAADEMVAFIAMIRDTARNYDPDFLVVAQNAADLCDDHPGYFSVIDGISQEDLSFYGESDVDWGNPAGGDQAQDPAYKTYLVSKLDLYLAAGLPVFTVDYCLIPANIDAAYAFSSGRGYIPFVTQTSLSQLPLYTPPGYVIAEESANHPDAISITAYPNPFNAAVTITAPANAIVEIFDVNGRLVASPLPSVPLPLNVRGKETASLSFLEGVRARRGRMRELVWQPEKSIGSGIYFARISTSTGSATAKIVFLR